MGNHRLSEEQMFSILSKAGRVSVAEGTRKHKISVQRICVLQYPFGVLGTLGVQ
jgi:hypothetical protein